jgi:hypothetical protein
LTLPSAAPDPHWSAFAPAVWRRSVGPALGIVGGALLCVPVAFFALFSSFAPYDDEGYLLILLRQYAQGGVLYDQLFGHYGPAYFQLLNTLFAMLQLSFAHSAGRSVTIALWVSTSALCGLATYRLTRNLPAALCAQLLVFVGLQLRNEPLHPGGLLCCILSLVIVAGSFLRTTRNGLAAGVIGALLALAVLIKINVGIFALASTVFALLLRVRTDRGGRFVRVAASTVMLVLPLLLTANHWSQPWVRTYACVVCCATVAVVLIELQAPAPCPGARRDLFTLLLSFTLTAAASCSWARMRGTSTAGLLQGIILAPLGQPHAFSVPLKLPPVAPWWAVFSALLAVLFVRARRDGWLDGRSAAFWHGLAQLLAGSIIWLSAARVLPLSPFVVSLPLLWVPFSTCAANSSPDERRLGKSLLAAVAVLQALHAYPVAGSQTTWATFLFIPVGAIGIADGWRNMVAAAPRWIGTGTPRFARLTTCLAILMVTFTVKTAVYDPGRQFKAAYDDGVPLNLPGAERVRVPAAQAAMLGWLTHNLSARCKTFMTMPGLNSLYLFTHTQPPTSLSTTAWMTMFTAAQQAEMRDRFSQSPAPLCVIRNRKLVKFWTQGRDLSDNPLARYIDDQFVTAATLGGYEFMTQRNRAGPAAPPTSGAL